MMRCLRANVCTIGSQYTVVASPSSYSMECGSAAASTIRYTTSMLYQ